ncbi:hypothetical protein CDD80_2736 [Ophiocordyceps camponoti-rufipedis]|uniref:Uncharacterized protein n=1 Tax=Ophiocordyceps camponoti-rufipedis TaxID=2004952 RepID=A0A2C5YZF4_9HYPO|nr:hypothetical protein CDD80_2736 [Ophiocordyceps camponoti-rufipedis]
MGATQKPPSIPKRSGTVRRRYLVRSELRSRESLALTRAIPHGLWGHAARAFDGCGRCPIDAMAWTRNSRRNGAKGLGRKGKKAQQATSAIRTPAVQTPSQDTESSRRPLELTPSRVRLNRSKARWKLNPCCSKLISSQAIHPSIHPSIHAQMHRLSSVTCDDRAGWASILSTVFVGWPLISSDI